METGPTKVAKKKKKTNKPQRNKDRNEASFIPFSIALFFKHFSHRSPGDNRSLINRKNALRLIN